MRFRLDERDFECEIEHLVIAGWTGRDRAALDHHIAELAALGVKPPASVPCFYRVGASLLTQADSIQVAGGDSSGEVEYFLLATREGLLVGLGSDHTDRRVESYGVTVSKQMCPKPMARQVWRFEEVAPHWDRLTLSSWRVEGASRTLCQRGPVANMLAPRDLIARYLASVGARADSLTPGTAMFCGTFGAIGGVRGAPRFEMELVDPVRGRRIVHGYDVQTLPIVD